MELVTEPVIHDAETAGGFARELQLLLRTLGASEANLEKGEMRIEANVSVAKLEAPSTKNQIPNRDQEPKLGTKVEVKNLNSFRSVERAIAYEITRQSAMIEKGERVTQETRGWDEGKQETFAQRLKEGSADYRYFSEPDLPKLKLHEVPELRHDAISASLPELPADRRSRYAAIYGLKADDIVFLSQPERSGFFDAVASELNNEKILVSLAANYFISDLAGDQGSLLPKSYAALIRMTNAGEVSSRGAKDILGLLKTVGGEPALIAKEKGLLQVNDIGALENAVLSILEANPSVVKDYKAGKEASLQYLVGQAMKATKGAGNPALLRELLIKSLGA
jgi:aspartyl-tRNA(Asn)/glutamyl-tRNA(Gln) amidotransferase subunit B